MNRDHSAASCPLRNQSGAEGIQNFDAILASLPPDLRAAFEQERAERQAEITAHIATFGYHT